MVATLFMAVFIGDFFHYWRHRLDHARLLWPSHAMHHSSEAKAFDKNFGEFFCIFDKAFGTYYLPGPYKGPLGEHHDMAPTLRGQLGYAFTPKAYVPFVKLMKR